MIDGYVKAHPTYIKQLPENDRSLVTVRSTTEGKVGILIGGVWPRTCLYRVCR